jgi:hypothetical protein
MYVYTCKYIKISKWTNYYPFITKHWLRKLVLKCLVQLQECLIWIHLSLPWSLFWIWRRLLQSEAQRIGTLEQSRVRANRIRTNFADFSTPPAVVHTFKDVAAKWKFPFIAKFRQEPDHYLGHADSPHLMGLTESGIVVQTPVHYLGDLYWP